MKKPRFGGDGRSSREDAEREAQEELNRLTRRSGPPPSSDGPPAPPPARSSYSKQRGSYAAPPASRAPAPPPAPRSYGPPPAESRSPGFTGRAPVAGDDEEYDDDEVDENDLYHAPRSAKEEEEAVTGLALQDWATWRGQADRMEDFALPRLDATSIEAQRDKALREVLERQERLQREYRDRLKPVEGSTEVSDLRAAHQMNVLRQSKPPGMMNMAAVQTGNLNRQRRERMVIADDLVDAAPAKGKTKKAPAAGKATKAAKPAAAAARTSGKAAPPAAARKPAKAAPVPRAAAPTTKAARPASSVKAPAKAARAPVVKATATPTGAGRKVSTTAKAPVTPPRRAVAKAIPAPTAVRPLAKDPKPVTKTAKPAAKSPRRG